MTDSWNYHMPVSVQFGVGVRAKLFESIVDQSCLIVSSARGRKQFENDSNLSEFLTLNRILWIDSVSPNPGIDELQTYIENIKDKKIDTVIGFGGGSCLDAAKIISLGLLPKLKNYTLRELLDDPSLHESIKRLPLYTVPTTSGTGSEVTPFATIWDYQKKKKYSITSSESFPRVAYVDPELTLDIPIETTISTGLDAINQAAESVWNKSATPITLFYAFKALKLGLEALPRLLENESGIDARACMAESSLFAGLAISQTRTALCHSISYPLTAHFGVPHGLACAFTMPAVLRHNLKSKDPRFDDLELFLNQGKLTEVFDSLNEKLNVRSRVLAFISETESLFDLIPEMYTPDRADNNISKVNTDDIKSILRFSISN
tara:strand:- start:148 stop:1278 length:1131 start_codon:yes stop_codon:yes gene_type:complete